jgi:hypothetical protein
MDDIKAAARRDKAIIMELFWRRLKARGRSQSDYLHTSFTTIYANTSMNLPSPVRCGVVQSGEGTLDHRPFSHLIGT